MIEARRQLRAMMGTSKLRGSDKNRPLRRNVVKIRIGPSMSANFIAGMNAIPNVELKRELMIVSHL